MVDGDWQRRHTQAVNGGAQGRELLRIAVVAGEQDDAADQRVLQAFAVEVAEFEAGNVDHQGAEGLGVHDFSRMTKATA